MRFTSLVRERNFDKIVEDSPSPVRLKVPAFRKYDTIHSIVSNLIEGTIDDKDLQMNVKSPNNNEFDTPFKEPNQICPNNDLLSESFRKKNASIKFDKFAELLIYVDANKNNANLLDNQASATAQGTINNKRIHSKHSLVDLTDKETFNRSSEFFDHHDDEDERFTPILKKRYNNYAKEEIERAVSCDKVPVEDFIVFFETHERRRMEAEPMLGEVRQRQVENYYDFVDE